LPLPPQLHRKSIDTSSPRNSAPLRKP